MKLPTRFIAFSPSRPGPKTLLTSALVVCLGLAATLLFLTEDPRHPRVCRQLTLGQSSALHAAAQVQQMERFDCPDHAASIGFPLENGSTVQVITTHGVRLVTNQDGKPVGYLFGRLVALHGQSKSLFEPSTLEDAGLMQNACPLAAVRTAFDAAQTINLRTGTSYGVNCLTGNGSPQAQGWTRDSQGVVTTLPPV